MRILPIQNQKVTKPNFKGYTVNGYGYYDGNLYAAQNTGRRMDKTLGVFHPNTTGKIYYADPLEKITDKIREQVDYIVYDDEPALNIDMDKEVSKMYFFRTAWDDEKKFIEPLEKLREYFYRLEIADSKTVGEWENKVWSGIDVENARANADYFKDHVRDAKYNQETLATCKNIFYDSKDLREAKDKYYDEIKNIESHIESREEDVKLAQKILEQRTNLNNIIKTKIANLESLKAKFASLLATINLGMDSNKIGTEFVEKEHAHNRIQQNSRYKTFLTEPERSNTLKETNRAIIENNSVEKEEKNHIETKIAYINKSIADYTSKLKENDAFLEKVKTYQAELPGIIEGLKNSLRENQTLFEKAKADLIPHFEKLKNYFLTRGIKVIR